MQQTRAAKRRDDSLLINRQIRYQLRDQLRYHALFGGSKTKEPAAIIYLTFFLWRN